jgi:D-lactate dehydrogenase (cytochrome)
VPISRLAECIDAATEALSKVSFPSTIVGHVGDGNFHVLMLLDPNSESEWQESERLNYQLVTQAIDADGTCTGEHGIGLHKKQFMVREHGEDALDLMRTLKQSFDPKNILNPGKVIDPRI